MNDYNMYIFNYLINHINWLKIELDIKLKQKLSYRKGFVISENRQRLRGSSKKLKCFAVSPNPQVWSISQHFVVEVK